MSQHSRWLSIVLLMLVGAWPPNAGAQSQAGSNTELLKAASAGDLDEMQKALADGADPNTRDADKMTALILASIGGHEKVARVLLDNRADVNARGVFYATALHGALENRHTDVAKLLIERGADVKAVDGHGAMLVPLAVGTHDVALVRKLLDKGADVEGRDAQAEPALYLAVGNGDIPMATLLLSHHANPNRGDSWVGSPLSSAIVQNSLELVKLLLEHGANADGGMSENGETNLMVAAARGSTSIMDAMLAASRNVDQSDKFGYTALMVAAREGQPDAVRLLLAHHADVTKTTGTNDTALSLALQGKTDGHAEAARLLRKSQRAAVQSTAWAVPIKSDIKVYLDGKEIPTVSTYDGESTSPIVVDGQLLIPIRFVNEHLDKDLFLDRGWGIIQLRAGLLLKIGSREWHTTTDYSTDNLNMSIGQLATAPHEIRGRLYMPVDRALFRYLQLTFEWNREKSELRFVHIR